MIEDAVGMRKILVVGGAGYLGSILVRRLLSEGYDVRVLDLLLFGEEPVREFINNPRFELVKGDIRNIPVITQAIEGIDAVIHLAAVVGDPACRSQPTLSVETNFLASRMLAEACKYHRISRFIYASTCSVYGVSEGIATEETAVNPQSLYAKTKIESEKGILGLADDNFAPCSLRMATLHGWSPRMRFDLVVNTMTMHAITRGVVTIQGGKQWRPLLHVDDAADAYVRCLLAPLDTIRGHIFNVGSSNQNYQIINLGQMVKQEIPEVRLVIESQIEDVRDYQVSFKRIEQITGFQPKSTVEYSIKNIADCLSKQRDIDVNNSRYYNYNEA